MGMWRWRKRLDGAGEGRPAPVVSAWCAAALLALLTMPADAKLPFPRKGDAEPHRGVAAALRKPVQGIDVSHWQQEIDWAAVARAGTRFAFIKATEGGDHLDPRFRENWAGARRAGIPRGAYHFVFWCRSAADQIRWFKRNVPREAGALPPVLDVEWNNHSRCPRTTPEKARAKMRVMLAAFERHYGQKPIIYTDINFHKDVLEGTTEFNDYPFWLRSTAAHPRARYRQRPFEFWQFTTTGRVPGVVGNVDRNGFYGTEREFRDWLAGRYCIGRRKALAPPAASTPALATRSQAPRQVGAPARADAALLPPRTIPAGGVARSRVAEGALPAR